jgi:hypothetical protein
MDDLLFGQGRCRYCGMTMNGTLIEEHEKICDHNIKNKRKKKTENNITIILPIASNNRMIEMTKTKNKIIITGVDKVTIQEKE